MDQRKEAILRHLAAYRFSTREVIQDHLIRGDASKELNRLAKVDGLIRTWPRILGGGRSVYQLTPKAARQQSLPLSIADPPKPQGLLANLSLLYFCFCGDRKRFRLEGEDEAAVLGPYTTGTGQGRSTHATYHVLEPGDESGGGPPVVRRVYVPSPNTGREKIEEKLYAALALVNALPGASALLAARRYSVAVVVQNENRKRSLNSWLQGRNIAQELPFTFSLVPDFLLPVAQPQQRSSEGSHVSMAEEAETGVRRGEDSPRDPDDPAGSADSP